MSDSAPQSTLRRWRDHLRHPGTLVTLAGVAALLTLLAPFGTGEMMRTGPRAAYWLALVALTYSAGFLANEGLVPRLSTLPGPVRVAALALAIGAAASVLVLAINYAAFGFVPAPAALPGFLGTVFAMAGIVTVVIAVLERHLAPAVGAAPAAPPPILGRLPLDKRGALVALSVEDHYVRVRTTKGEEMILMRLRDAIRETAGTGGMQVHRSHWVALAAVRAARREGDRAVLTLSHGPEIPVSRSRVPELRARGLLPR